MQASRPALRKVVDGMLAEAVVGTKASSRSDPTRLLKVTGRERAFLPVVSQSNASVRESKDKTGYGTSS